MVSKELETLIQTRANYIISHYTETINGSSVKIFNGYTCIIHSEVDYQFQEATPMLIEANLLYGSSAKQNDIEDKYNQSFVINIQSEINGYEMAKKLFALIFEDLTRTYQTLGNFKCKLFLTSPVITNPFNAIESDYRVLMTMNGSLEMTKKVVLGATYTLSANGGNAITIKPRQPYVLKEAIGGMDTNKLSPNISKFSKSSNQRTINLILLYELDGTIPETPHDTLFKKLLNECYSASNDVYELICSVAGTPLTISNLICVRGQHIYDEATGENVLSLQFKEKML